MSKSIQVKNTLCAKKRGVGGNDTKNFTYVIFNTVSYMSATVKKYSHAAFYFISFNSFIVCLLNFMR